MTGDLLVAIPIDAETLVPVTRESIWTMSCKRSLGAENSRIWKELIARFEKDEKSRFNEGDVRVGFRLGGANFYLDKQLVLIGPELVVMVPRDREAKAALLQATGNFLGECEKP